MKKKNDVMTSPFECLNLLHSITKCVLFLYSIVFCMTGLCKTYTDTSFQHQYVNQFKTWSEAQEYCRSVHNDLVTVENMVAMGSLLKTVDPQYKGKVWIGLVRGTRKQVHWSLWENTQPITYTNWLAGEPNGGEGVCGAKCYNGQWCDLYCSDLAWFICFDENQGKNIVVYTQMSWNQAQLYCRQHYTDLASIPNSNVETEINNLIGGNLGQFIWTGLFLDSWEWSNSSKMSSFRNWKKAPTSYGNCAAVDVNNGSLWDNLSCELNLPFIYTSFQHQYVNQFKTWSEAQEYCRSVHNDLVTVENMVAMGSLLKTVDPQYKGKVWIGLVRGARKQWHWSLWENTQPITYTNWVPGEPSGGEDVCGAKCYNGQWCDLYCSTLAWFICFDGE
ncbi:hypothetical protein ACEWY4_010908 [Coilia grayii]|uniref:C-type lectin domain-containing protein n=1 Tax=Coilia grayii TaxID=363190 RepID=A0ABD1K378_9TELE